MPIRASPAFLIWHHSTASGDWTRLLQQPATTAVQVALCALQDLPSATVMMDHYNARLAAALAKHEAAFLQRFGVTSALWDGV